MDNNIKRTIILDNYENPYHKKLIDDNDVKKVLSLLTYLPMEEVNRLSSLEGAEINGAKKNLLFHF